jgi:hypothetical protein
MLDFPADLIDKPGYTTEWNDEFQPLELDTSKRGFVAKWWTGTTGSMHKQDTR